MKTKLFRTVLLAGFSGFIACSMTAQQAPQPTQAALRTKKPPAKPAPKKAHKVWSDDDIATLRTPEDKYVEAKETSPAVQPKASAAPTAPAKPAASPATPIKLPETIEKTEQVIRENTQDMHDAEDNLRQLKAGWTATPEAQKTQKQAEIDRNEKLIEDERADLKILQNHLEKLRASQPGNRTPSAQ